MNDDLISRKDAILEIEKHLREAVEPYQLSDVDKIKNYAFEVAVSCVSNLPSAQPDVPDINVGDMISRQWIPCSERLPKNDDFVIITVLDEHGDTPFKYSDFGWYLDKAACWIVEAQQRNDVVAWMPLPKPYWG